MTALAPPRAPPAAPSGGGGRALAGGLLLVLAVAMVAFATLFFLKSGDAMILVFGLLAVTALGALGVGALAMTRGPRPGAPASAGPIATPLPALRCASCGGGNPAGARFCNACGKPL